MSRPSDPKKLTAWRERFGRFSRTGLAVSQFCARERVSVASFYHWRKKLGPKGQARRGRGRRGVFQQVELVQAASRMGAMASAVRIELPCGTRIEVGTEDLDAVRTVICEVVRADRGRDTGVASC
jgi:hypothetical protein